MLFSIPAQFQPVVIQVLSTFYESRNACIQTSDILPVQIDQTVKMCTVRNCPTICSYLQLIPIRRVALRISLYPSENISILHICPLRPKTQHFFIWLSAIIPHDLGIFHIGVQDGPYILLELPDIWEVVCRRIYQSLPHLSIAFFVIFSLILFCIFRVISLAYKELHMIVK